MVNFNSFLSTFYPLNCKCCEIPLVYGEKHFCLNCEINFGEIRHDQKEEINQLFWGKVKIYEIVTIFQFLKEEHFQNLIHKLKYKGDRYLCFDIGQLLGSYIEKFQFDVISFVPMHEKKEKKRGFNQAELIANGIAKN